MTTAMRLLETTGREAPPAMPARTATPIAVRPAVADDIAAINRIYNESLPAQDAAPPPPDATLGGRLVGASRQMHLSDAQMLAWAAQHHGNGRPLWVAEAHGQVAGWLSLLGFSDRPNCTYAAEVAIYVERASQGRGVGHALLAHAVRDAPRWHVDRLMALIWHDNLASQALFRRHGFGAWGAMPGIVWADARSRDMLILGRILS